MVQTKSKLTQQDMIFREITLMLGGAFAVQGTDDKSIRRVMHGLERIYRRYRQKSQPQSQSLELAPHPSVASFLQHIGDEGDES